MNPRNRKARTGIEDAVACAGSLRKLARKVGVSYQTVQRWVEVGYVPATPIGRATRVHDVARATGVALERLNPQVYGQPELRRLHGT